MRNNEIKKKQTKRNKERGHNTVANCTFIGVHFDEEVVQTISLIANGLIENAKALGALANSINSSNINIDALMKIE